MTFYWKLSAVALLALMGAGCASLSAEDKALLDQTRQQAAAAEQAAERAESAASRAESAANRAESAADRAEEASEKSARIFDQLQQK